ncbi:hypothetical protein MLD38_038969 [Melastoma candidum]|uniref:Uncharacterized protein n=1 Tax=Melastoma candidum TaxID=119954 RepID=A0ACB9L1R9_9MYRT|nr:hypothetical protein MLD38_038969 [Melastoma candidum]
MDEEEVWKCPAHPSKRRPYGVCPKCLRDKLSSLCPDCASLRPCSCSSSSSSDSSSDSSSSFSRFFSSSRSSSTAPDRHGKAFTHFIDSEPTFGRSRSVATLHLPSFLHSRSKVPGRDSNPGGTPLPGSARTVRPSFWGKFRRERRDHGSSSAEEERRTMMGKSRSVAAGFNNGNFSEMSSGSKGRGRWSKYLKSPMKAFGGGGGHSRSRSPLFRG